MPVLWNVPLWLPSMPASSASRPWYSNVPALTSVVGSPVTVARCSEFPWSAVPGLYVAVPLFRSVRMSSVIRSFVASMVSLPSSVMMVEPLPCIVPPVHRSVPSTVRVPPPVIMPAENVSFAPTATLVASSIDSVPPIDRVTCTRERRAGGYRERAATEKPAWPRRWCRRCPAPDHVPPFVRDSVPASALTVPPALSNATETGRHRRASGLAECPRVVDNGGASDRRCRSRRQRGPGSRTCRRC